MALSPKKSDGIFRNGSTHAAPDDAQTSEVRRVRLVELWHRVRQFCATEDAQGLRTIVESVHLLREERYLADAENFTKYAAGVRAFHSN